MGSSSFIGTASSELSGAAQVERWIKEITAERHKKGQPRYWIIGIDYGIGIMPQRIPVVIGK